MTQPTPLDETIEDQQPNHSGLHSEERVRINVDTAKAWEAKDRADEAWTLANTKLAATALNTIVQTDGTVLRAVKLTQAAYDALSPKVATTLYVIVG